MNASIFALAILAAASVAAAAAPTVVATQSGRLGGVLEGETLVYKGIPYAAPPVGPLRWRAPQPVQRWTGVRVADHFGAICWQPPKPTQDNGVGEEAPSEDCLTLNVYRPAMAKAGAKAPVMVWIHGGGLINGSSSAALYNGDAFAARGVVLVSINYRLGRLGFFAHPALTAEGKDGGHVGNYGLMDQIAALRWVRRNIAAFGGDPDRVTVFGESAGAASVDALMVSPEARGLFQRAVAESGYGRGAYQRVSVTGPGGRPSAESSGVALAAALGLTNPTAAQLRAVPPQTIVEKTAVGETFGFTLDGHTLTEDLWTAFHAGHEAPVPFILGSNGLEFPSQPGPALDKGLRVYMSDDQRAALAEPYGGAAARDLNLMSDVQFNGQTRALARMHRQNGYATYLYRFTAVAASRADVWKGARHASERQYVFDTLSASTWPTGARDEALAKAMNADWARFAATGDPNGPGAVPWPAYDGERLMDFTSDGPVARTDPWAVRLDALAAAIDPRF